MKIFKQVERLFLLDGGLWMEENNYVEIGLGTVLYDSRLDAFVELETIEKVDDYSFVDPELYTIMKSVEIEEK